jgi:hypothetical protein
VAYARGYYAGFEHARRSALHALAQAAQPPQGTGPAALGAAALPPLPAGAAMAAAAAAMAAAAEKAAKAATAQQEAPFAPAVPVAPAAPAALAPMEPYAAADSTAGAETTADGALGGPTKRNHGSDGDARGPSKAARVEFTVCGDVEAAAAAMAI